MTAFYALHTKEPLKKLELEIEGEKLILEKMNKETEMYFYYPKMHYEDDKEYFYWIEYEMWFAPCGCPEFYEWVKKELKKNNKISIFYMMNVETNDKELERQQWERCNSIYEKKYFKIDELIKDPDKLDFAFNIEYEFIL